VFDEAGMMVRMMDDTDLARTVIKGYLTDLPNQIATLKAALAAGDVEGATRQAHSTKSASGSVGGQALSHMALGIEQAGKRGDLAAMAAGMPELEAHADTLRKALTDFSNR
jgi:HPt (histidine-containing phosphotransfer) domain-containing protein